MVKINMNVPESFIEVEIDEFRNGKFNKYSAIEANHLLTRANPVVYSEGLQQGSHLHIPNAIGIFASGPNVKFEYQDIQKEFAFKKIPYQDILDCPAALLDLRSTFLERIRAVRGWTDQQIEVKCSRVGPEKLGIFDEESRDLFSEGDGKLHVLVQYLMTNGPKQTPNINIFINGNLCKNRMDNRPKDLRWSTEEIVAKGAIGRAQSLNDHLSIFTPESPMYQYGKWKTITMGMDINYNGDLRAIEQALKYRILNFRKEVTNRINVDVRFAGPRTSRQNI